MSTAAFDGLTASQKTAEVLKVEIQKCDEQIKDWFLTRRLKAERAVSFKKQLDAENFTGLAPVKQTSAGFIAEKQLWNEIVHEKPQLEDSLSGDARLRKADRYLNVFESSTDRSHICRIPGMLFFRCLKDNYALDAAARESKCVNSFAEFNACRTAVKTEEEIAIKNSLDKQQAADASARAAFERRTILNAELQKLL